MRWPWTPYVHDAYGGRVWNEFSAITDAVQERIFRADPVWEPAARAARTRMLAAGEREDPKRYHEEKQLWWMYQRLARHFDTFNHKRRERLVLFTGEWRKYIGND